MQNVPKIVRERLKAGTPTGHHPDADVLTAFAECSLPEGERAVVLQHLARCGDCRDVLALALPEPEVAQPVIAPARGGWLTWPALRWGFVAAGGVAIVSIGILQYQRHLTSTATIAKEAKPEAVAITVQTQPAAPSPAETPVKNEKARTDANSVRGTGKKLTQNGQLALAAPRASQQPQTGAAVASNAFHGQTLHGPAMPTQWQQQQTARMQASPLAAPSSTTKQPAADMAANPPIPSAAEVVEVQAQGVPEQADTQTRNQDSELQAQGGAAAQQHEYSSRAVGKAKPAVNVEAKNAAQAQPMGGPALQPAVNARNFTQLSDLAAALPRWTISASGGLQRSFDQGQTWQDVDASANPVPAAGFTSTNYASVDMVAETARAKDSSADKKALKKTAAAAVIFRAVAAIGAEVWAGGSNAALYHSLDAGSHWTRVLPLSGGATLTGDIVAVEFSDPQHGKVTTSTTEVWITGNGGQAWQEQ